MNGSARSSPPSSSNIVLNVVLVLTVGFMPACMPLGEMLPVQWLEVVDPLPNVVATPISHAKIELWDSKGTRKHFEVFSDDDGSFHADRLVGGVALLQPWFYRLRVSRDGFEPLDCTIPFRYRGNRFAIRLKPLN